MNNYILVLIPFITFILTTLLKKRKSVHFFIVLSSLAQIVLTFVLKSNDLRFIFLLMNNLNALLLTLFLYRVYKKLIIQRRAKSKSIGRKYSVVFLITAIANLIICIDVVWLMWVLEFAMFMAVTAIYYMNKEYFDDIKFHILVLFSTIVPSSIMYTIISSLMLQPDQSKLKAPLYFITAIGIALIGVGLYYFSKLDNIVLSNLSFSAIIYGIVIISFGVFNYSGVYTAIYHMIFGNLALLLSYFTSENISLNYKTDKFDDIKGVLTYNPTIGILTYVAIMCVTSLPPFALFFSEIRLLINSFSVENYLITFVVIAKFLILLYFVFKKYIPILYDKPVVESNCRNLVYGTGIMVLIIVLILFLGLFMPVQLSSLISNSASIILDAI